MDDTAAALSPEVIQSLQAAQDLRTKSAQFGKRIEELVFESNEHTRVLSVLKEMENAESRKCFRMVGEVLVERNIPNVVKELNENLERILQAIQTLESQRSKTEQEANTILTSHQSLLEEIGRREALNTAV